MIIGLRASKARFGCALRCILVALAVSGVAGQTAAARPPLVTAIQMGETLQSDAELDLAFARIKAGGATAVRLDLRWANVAPERPQDPANPSDLAYRWDDFDRFVRLAHAHRLDPIVTFLTAPKWAEGHPTAAVPADVDPAYGSAFRPDPVQFAQFAHAAASRYAGAFLDLPRIRYWHVWNEPNATRYLMPQFVRGKAASPEWYRQMVNRMAAAVKTVHADNVVIAGGLSPFTYRSKGLVVMPPLVFMRKLLCLSRGDRPRATCSAKVRFDVWAHHPYTSGGPTHHAIRRDDVSLGDLGEMRGLIRVARRKGHIVSRGTPGFFVTEFVWDSRPPDPDRQAVPLRLHARWVSEALYRMWKAGVTLVTWHQLRDFPSSTSPFQGGLYFQRGPSLTRDRPKPALVAFRFPFVAFRQGGGRVLVWGRTPAGVSGRIVVEEKTARSWRRLAGLAADRHGIFTARLRGSSAPARHAAAGRRAQSVSYREQVLGDAPASYWRLGEMSGQIAADETGDRPGAYLGGVKRGAPGALAGDPNRAVHLDGHEGRISLGSIASPRTVEAWVRTSTRESGPIFSNRDVAGNLTMLGSDSAGRALGGASLSVVGGRDVADGRWHYLALTRGGPVVRLYVDGILDAQAFAVDFGGSAPANLGFDAALRAHFRGDVDEVAIYDHPLTPAQVARHFRAGGRPSRASDEFVDFMTRGKGPFLRARLANGSAASLPFSLVRPPDRPVRPFGGGG